MTTAIPNPTGCCGIPTECCENALPETLHAELFGIEFCECANGVHIALEYDEDRDWWTGCEVLNGPGTCDPFIVLCLRLFCINGTWMLDDDDCNESWGHPEPASSAECEPLELKFTIPLAGSCLGTSCKVDVVITE